MQGAFGNMAQGAQGLAGAQGPTSFAGPPPRCGLHAKISDTRAKVSYFERIKHAVATGNVTDLEALFEDVPFLPCYLLDHATDYVMIECLVSIGANCCKKELVFPLY